MWDSRGGRAIVLMGMLIAGLLGSAGSARAWTEARVTGVTAQLEVLPEPGLTRVRLEIRLRVLGGWLSRFEIHGLDADLVLAADAPPSLHAQQQDGKAYSPIATLDRNGALVLDFGRRKHAPPRGEYIAHVSYDTPAPLRAAETLPGHARVRWQLPSWEVGLEDVRIVVRAPRGTRPVHTEAPRAYGDQISVRDESGTSELTFARVQLPHTQAWEIAFDVPQARAVTATTLPSGISTAQLPSLLLCMFASLLLLLGKRRSAHAACARYALRARDVVPLPNMLRAGSILLGTVSGFLLFTSAPLLATLGLGLAVLLTLPRRLERLPGRAGGHFRAAQRADAAPTLRARLRTLAHAESWFDATHPAGALLLLLTYLPAAASFAHGGGDTLLLWTALCVTPLFFAGTRRHRPASTAQRLQRLSQVRAALCAQGLRADLIVGATESGSASACTSDARLRVALTSSLDGLSHLDLVVADGSLYGRPRSTLAWLVMAQLDSAADHALAKALPEAQAIRDAASDQHVRFALTSDAVRDARTLLAWLDAPLARAA